MKRTGNKIGIASGRKPRKVLPLIFTVGHSTRTGKEFLDLLRAHNVRQLIDVRTIPRSRHNPQFNRSTLSRSLRRAGLGYRHMPKLGGLRHPRTDSLNTSWRNKSFRGYADYMQSREFQAGLRKLIALARQKRVALMCAEAVPWRCHRSLIADALLVRGFGVEEIQSATRTRPHSLTPWARVERLRITYPAESAEKQRARPIVEFGRRTPVIQLKRVYDKASSEDGKRFLVERLWPRGIKKTALHVDAWLKEAGPSTALRKWFGHDPKKWNEFRRRYFDELEKKPEAWREILLAALGGKVTLVYSSHDTVHNNAAALKEFLETKMSSGDTKERVGSQATAASSLAHRMISIPQCVEV
jgi:uncharacterized protein YeaO (DUF488 family)